MQRADLRCDGPAEVWVESNNRKRSCEWPQRPRITLNTTSQKDIRSVLRTKLLRSFGKTHWVECFLCRTQINLVRLLVTSTLFQSNITDIFLRSNVFLMTDTPATNKVSRCYPRIFKRQCHESWRLTREMQLKYNTNSSVLNMFLIWDDCSVLYQDFWFCWCQQLGAKVLVPKLSYIISKSS